MGNLALQWLTTAVLWFHVAMAVMWIGASFYWVSWENKLNRTSALRAGVEGDLWTLQGGDFYFIEKHRRAPPEMPARLHLFRYEAYLTWISGFALLCLVFYLGAETKLANARTASVPPALLIVAGITSLLCSWLVYAGFCRTALVHRMVLTAGLGLVAMAAAGYLLGQIFGERAAFMHVGAALGTIMAANVFFVIIPWHRALIRAIETGQPLDDLYKRHPGIRSIHNHYLALPVLFIMLGSHVPLLVGHPNSWLLLTGIALSGGLVKHAHNLAQQGRRPYGYLALGLSCFVLVATFSLKSGVDDADCAHRSGFGDVRRVVNLRCVPCHSSTPTSWPVPAAGIRFDTPETIAVLKDRILDRVVLTRSMPPPMHMEMTPSERNTIGCWIRSGGIAE